MSESGRTRIACVEDADDLGNPIENSAKYAASVASPTKERPNTGRTRRERERRNSSSPITNAYTDSDSTAHPAIERRQSIRVKPGKERERSTRDREIEGGRSTKKAIVTMRPPPPQRTATTPPVPSAPRYDAREAREVEASYYGISPMITPGHSRPRAQTSNPRPASYYGGRPMAPPPQSNARFYQQQAPTPPPLPTSYPPRAWASTPHGSYPIASPVISQPPPQQEYFTRPLESRFGVNRPQSAIGHRQSRQLSYEYEEPSEPQPQRALSRHPSSKRQVARTEMAPPPRPQSARPSGTLFRPPPTPLVARKPTPFDDEDFGGNDELFHTSPLARNYHYQSPVAVARQRRPSISDTRSINYDLGEFRTEVAGRRSRRDSYYTDRSGSSSSGYEDKIKSATVYQNGISGGNSLPLTAESLRKANKNGGSSQSTRSTRSRDESDYRKSATTRTTRSSAENNEDVTIRVRGLATLEVGGAKMQCQDGAEIKVSARGGSYRGGSDESSYMGDDRRSKYDRDRPATRTRASSQAGSYSRAPPPMPFPPYNENQNPLAPLPSPYDHAPYSYAPPYPAYTTRDPAYSTRGYL